MAKPLKGRVAVVAGATRGAGRGIATALGEAGATVYCTGRSSGKEIATPGRTETIEETAALVEKAGGRGVSVRVDHLVERDVVALFRRVESEAARLDLLVNDIWGGDALTEWGKPLWELSVEKGLEMLRTALHTHILTARHGTPLMVKQGSGLVVEITDGNGYWYRGNLFYDLVKTAVIRLAFDYSEDLSPKGVHAVAVTPGFLRSEAMLDNFGVTETNWRDAVKKNPDFEHSETPLFVGRAVAALAADKDIAKKTGRVFASWDLAEEYGFDDADGRRPHWMRHFRKRYGDIFHTADDSFYRQWSGWKEIEPQIQLPPG